MTDTPLFLTNLWYMAAMSSSLKPGGLRREMLCGEPVLLGRDKNGAAFAMRDICPHRAAPLSAGRIVDGAVECPYHGWRFKPDGLCSHIPSLVPGQDFDVARIKVRTYPLKEQDGLIWVYVPDDAKSGSTPASDPPRIPVSPARPRLVLAQMFPCEVDHAVVGLMDPAHGPFVHSSWYWRKASSIHEKAKHHAPSERGFTMVGHKPSSNSALYRILGGDMSTEIRFELPSLRFERIRAGRTEVLGFTAVTPKDAHNTLVTQIFYWNAPWLNLIGPIFRPFARAFLGQDRKIVELQNEGLKFEPSQMLIPDADMPAMWYHRLKKAWADSVKTGTPFVNPVQERTLRWRS